MKIFVLGVPHTQTTRAFNTCPFTMKAWYQCQMLHRRGHEVIHIGVEGSDPECSENVAAISRDEWGAYYDHPGANFYDTRTDGKVAAYHELYAARVRAAIDARVSRPWEAIVACTWGEAQIRATQGLAQFVVETGVGYRHTWAKYRVFVSYAWMHFHYGAEGKHAGNGWYDVVIPNEIDPELFGWKHGRLEACPTKTDELLFMGRLNDDKGVALAIDVAKRVGRKIVIVGQGDPARFLKDNPHARYLPPVDCEGRRKLMAEAAAFLCPTQYIEPLGNVALEAQASGTPVICTDWGGFTETVLHGVTGYRCRTMEQFVWAAKNIDRIDPATCRRWVIDNFSTERVGQMFEEYYQMLLDLDGDGWYVARPERQQLDWLTKRFPAGGRHLETASCPPTPSTEIPQFFLGFLVGLGPHCSAGCKVLGGWWLQPLAALVPERGAGGC
jgi:glycosyltransferase involved in cell wall biosynthesis